MDGSLEKDMLARSLSWAEVNRSMLQTRVGE